MNAHYKQALEAAQEAGKAWQAAKLAYRCGFITDEQFKVHYKWFKASEEAFDAAYFDASQHSNP